MSNCETPIHTVYYTFITVFSVLRITTLMPFDDLYELDDMYLICQRHLSTHFDIHVHLVSKVIRIYDPKPKVTPEVVSAVFLDFLVGLSASPNARSLFASPPLSRGCRFDGDPGVC